MGSKLYNKARTFSLGVTLRPEGIYELHVRQRHLCPGSPQHCSLGCEGLVELLHNTVHVLVLQASAHVPETKRVCGIRGM